MYSAFADRLDEIQARLAALPDTTWRQRPGDAGLIEDITGQPVAVLGTSGDTKLPVGEFIAHAPDDIAWLAAEVTRLRCRAASPRPTPLASRTGWDQANFRCGQCGAQRTATTEVDYIRTVSAHREAHAVFDRLNLVERSGMGSILRTLLHDIPLSTELLTLIETGQQHPS
ncbi:hypothetical protein ACFCZ6_14215 [Streptomyces hydrogenans]|uniref:hypothetical protein n=1 Tax=Streptomyces hydrogenans TaxID=1873719 RepID=UPI0035DEE387